MYSDFIVEPGELPENARLIDRIKVAPGYEAALGAALGDDFSAAAGSYILAAPSTPAVAAADDDYFRGIWFLDPTAGPAASLMLPTLPAGW